MIYRHNPRMVLRANVLRGNGFGDFFKNLIHPVAKNSKDLWGSLRSTFGTLGNTLIKQVAPAITKTVVGEADKLIDKGQHMLHSGSELIRDKGQQLINKGQELVQNNPRSSLNASSILSRLLGGRGIAEPIKEGGGRRKRGKGLISVDVGRGRRKRGKGLISVDVGRQIGSGMLRY